MKRITSLVVISFVTCLIGLVGPTAANDKKTKTDCCIREIDKEKAIIKVIPWYNNKEEWGTQEDIKQFNYGGKTEIKGKGKDGKGDVTFTLDKLKTRSVTILGIGKTPNREIKNVSDLVKARAIAYSAQIGHQFQSIPATCSRLNRPPNRSEATLVFLLLFRFVFLSQGRSYFSHGFSF